MQGTWRRRFAAIADIAVGPDEVQAFALGAIAVVKRAFGIEDHSSIQAWVRRHSSRFDCHEKSVNQVARLDLYGFCQIDQPLPRTGLMPGAREQEQGMLRPTQQLEQCSGTTLSVQQRARVERLLTRMRTGSETGLPKMAAFVLAADRAL